MGLLNVFLLTLATMGAVWGVTVVHEQGHYVTGRLLGVPAEAMSIRWERTPHVALRYEDEWLSPDHENYPRAFEVHNGSLRAAWCFIAGGVLVETAVVLILSLLLRDVGTVSLVVAGASNVVLLIYLIADIVLSKRGGHPYGDFSSMWAVARLPTAALIVTVSALRAGVFLLL